MSAASSFVTALSMALVSFVRCRFGAAFAARESLEHHDFAEPQLHRLGRCTAPAPTGRDIAGNVADRGDLRPFADHNVVIDAGARAQHDKVFQRRTAGNARLRHQNAVPADADIVAYLDHVVDLAALADHRVANGAAVDGGAGSDLDIVLDDDAPDLRNLEVALRPHYEAEAVLTDLAARMNDDAVADQRGGDRGPGADRAIAPGPHLSPDYGSGADDGAGADLGVRPDPRAGLDGDVVFQPRSRTHLRAGHFAQLGKRGRPQRVRK